MRNFKLLLGVQLCFHRFIPKFKALFLKSFIFKALFLKNLFIKSVQQERVLDFSKTIRDFKLFFLFNKSTLERLRRYYLIDSPVPIVVQNGLAPFRHAFH